MEEESSALGGSQLEFLNFDTNDDSLDLSLSASEFNDDSASLSSVRSGDSSDWTPSGFGSSDFDVSQDILADIHLPSLGESGAARKILSQLLSENENPAPPSRGQGGRGGRGGGHQYPYPSVQVSYTREGHAALQQMHEDLKYSRDRNAALQEELTQIKKKQMASRDELQDLDIGENLYHQLNKLEPADMTLREFACLRAASVYMPLRQRVQALERDLSEVQVQLELSNGTIESQTSELSRQRKQSQTMQETYRLDLLAAEERGDRLNTRLQVEIVKRQEREAQASRCDEAMADAEAMRKEASVLRNTVEEQSKLISTLSANDRKHNDLVADLTKAKDMLTMDKNYLQRELGDVTAAAHEQSRKVDTQQIQIEKLEAKVLELTDQLVNVQTATRTAFDDRMEKEVSRLRQDYDKDMNSIKDSSKEIVSQENRMLREIRENLERELETLRRKLDDRIAEVSSLTKELADVRGASESELSMLRAEIKMKHFEVTSLGATFEERSSQLKLAQLDLDVMREEVAVHKTALLKMESENMSKCARLEDDLARAYETIHAYDVLFSDDTHGNNDEMLKEQYRTKSRQRAGSDSDKKDVHDVPRASRRRNDSITEDYYSDDDWENDGVLDDTSEHRDSILPSTAVTTGAVSGRHSNVHKHSLSVLISNPRKFRHLLDSSERNIRTIERLKQRIRELEATNNQLLKDKKKLKEEISKNIRELALMPQTNKHVIDLYSQKDDECRLLHDRLANYERDAKEYRGTIESSLQENTSLRAKLKALIDERQELNELKALLIEFQQHASQEGIEKETAAGTTGDEDASMFIDRLATDSSFNDAQLQSPVYRGVGMDHTETDQAEAQQLEAQPSPRTEIVSAQKPAHSPDQQPEQSSPKSYQPSASFTPSSSKKLADLGVSPLVLKSMVERNPSGAITPIKSPSRHDGSAQRSSAKINFHMRSPVGK